MALTNDYKRLSLAEANSALEEAGVKKHDYKSEDHARIAVAKAINSGKIVYMVDGLQVTSVEVPAIVPKEKTSKSSKVEKNIEWIESGHDYLDREVFTRVGRGKVMSVGRVEGDTDPTKALVKMNKDGSEKVVSLSSCRFQAVNDDYRSKYAADKEVRTKSGKPSIGVQDEITEKLKGATSEKLKEIAEDNGIEWDKYSHLNNGMQRMSIGNRLRGRAKRGERVVIGESVVSEGNANSQAA